MSMDSQVWGQKVEETDVRYGNTSVFKHRGSYDTQQDSVGVGPCAVAIADGVGGSTGGGEAAELAVKTWVEEENREHTVNQFLSRVAKSIHESKSPDGTTTFVGFRRTGQELNKKVPVEMLSVGDSGAFLIDPQSREVLYRSPIVNTLTQQLQEADRTGDNATPSTIRHLFAILEERLQIENRGQLPQDPRQLWELQKKVVLTYATPNPDQLGADEPKNPVHWQGECPVGSELWAWTDGVSEVVHPFEIEEIVRKYGTTAGFIIVAGLVRVRKEHFIHGGGGPDPRILLGKNLKGEKIWGPIGYLPTSGRTRSQTPLALMTYAGDNSALVRWVV